jgi:pterin-4a-carbinolamine dehydratase
MWHRLSRHMVRAARCRHHVQQFMRHPDCHTWTQLVQVIPWSGYIQMITTCDIINAHTVNTVTKYVVRQTQWELDD